MKKTKLLIWMNFNDDMLGMLREIDGLEVDVLTPTSFTLFRTYGISIAISFVRDLPVVRFPPGPILMRIILAREIVIVSTERRLYCSATASELALPMPTTIMIVNVPIIIPREVMNTLNLFDMTE